MINVGQLKSKETVARSVKIITISSNVVLVCLLWWGGPHRRCCRAEEHWSVTIDQSVPLRYCYDFGAYRYDTATISFQYCYVTITISRNACSYVHMADVLMMLIMCSKRKGSQWLRVLCNTLTPLMWYIMWAWNALSHPWLVVWTVTALDKSHERPELHMTNRNWLICVNGGTVHYFTAFHSSTNVELAKT